MKGSNGLDVSGSPGQWLLTVVYKTRNLYGDCRAALSVWLAPSEIDTYISSATQTRSPLLACSDSIGVCSLHTTFR